MGIPLNVYWPPARCQKSRTQSSAHRRRQQWASRKDVAIGLREAVDDAIALDDDNVMTAVDICQVQGAGGAGNSLSHSGECERGERDRCEKERPSCELSFSWTREFAAAKTGSHCVSYRRPEKVRSHFSFDVYHVRRRAI